jgi:hypothetical protein
LSVVARERLRFEAPTSARLSREHEAFDGKPVEISHQTMVFCGRLYGRRTG